jgi:D-amino-acid oxidase
VRTIVVIGAGVLGLSAAHELALAGHQVRVRAEHDGVASVSGVAAAIWFPHDVPRNDRVLTSAAVTYRRLVELAAEPRTGVRMRTGQVLARHSDPDLSWTSALPSHRRLPASQLPPGCAGIECTLPMVVTDVYLAWLRQVVLDLGVPITTARVNTIDELCEAEPDVDGVVVAAGIRSAQLLGDDDSVYPIRGQVVRLANPGLTDWILDDENPAGLTYVVPRDHDVVCGGTGDIGSWDETIDPGVEASIRQRVEALVPALIGQPVLSRAVGLRPGRPDVRLEPVAGHRRPVFASYGHGGAGFTLAWGDAAATVDWANQL